MSVITMLYKIILLVVVLITKILIYFLIDIYTYIQLHFLSCIRNYNCNEFFDFTPRILYLTLDKIGLFCAMLTRAFNSISYYTFIVMNVCRR